MGTTEDGTNGRLVLVVGASGAGKDSLIAGAARLLEADPRFVFPRRVITRPSTEGGEPHRSVTVREFEALLADGAFTLHWEAHGFHYGVERNAETLIAEGRIVVVNASRAIVAAARHRFRGLRIVEVTAPHHVLAQRLRRRRRESQDEAEARLVRATAFEVSGGDVIRLANDGALDVAVERFVRMLRGFA